MSNEVIICNLTDKEIPKAIAYNHASQTNIPHQYRSINFKDLLLATQKEVGKMTENLVIETFFNNSKSCIIVFNEKNELYKKFKKLKFEQNINIKFERI